MCHRGDSNEYTQYTIFNIKKENHPKLSQSRGKRAVSVRATIAILSFSLRHVTVFHIKNVDPPQILHLSRLLSQFIILRISALVEFTCFVFLSLTHLSQATDKWDVVKERRPR